VVKWRVYTLVPKSKEAVWLKQTLQRYNEACEFIAEYAIAENEFRSNDLSKALSKNIQGRFHLPSGIVESAIKHVSHDYYCIPSKRRAVRQYMPTYADNKWVRYSDGSVSVVLLPTHVTQVAPYEHRLSISLAKDGQDKSLRRPKIDFKKGDPSLSEIEKSERWKTGDIRLTFSEDIARWQLFVVLDVHDAAKSATNTGAAEEERLPTDIQLNEDGSDPRESPDYQEPDFMPPEDVIE
jgi:hypothetical protein